jgi:putative MATE family efflux protein
MKKNNEMGTKSVPSLLLKFSLPAIIALLVNALYNIVDSIFVGRGVGDLALGGVSVSFPIVTTVIAFVMLIGMGATALISIYLGEKKEQEAEKILANAFILLIIVSLILSAIGLIFLEKIILFFGATEDVLPYTKSYMRIIFLGAPFLAISIGVNAFIRAEGNPKTAMSTMLIGAATNIVLDYIFIFIFKWGIQGAALATVLSYVTSSIWVVSYFFSKRSRLKLKFSNMTLDKQRVIKIIKIGFPTFVIQVTSSIQQLILNRSLGKYGGNDALAIIGVIMNVTTFLVMPAMGIGQGAQPIFGYNKGAKQDKRVKETLIYSLISATVIIFIGFLVAKIWPYQIFSLFSKSEELIENGVYAMNIFFKFIPLVGVQMIASNYFQAIGKSNQATILGLSRQVFLFIPIILILPYVWGLDGAWWSAPVSDLAAFILTGVWLFIEVRKESQTEEEQKDLYKN